MAYVQLAIRIMTQRRIMLFVLGNGALNCKELAPRRHDEHKTLSEDFKQIEF